MKTAQRPDARVSRTLAGPRCVGRRLPDRADKEGRASAYLTQDFPEGVRMTSFFREVESR